MKRAWSSFAAGVISLAMVVPGALSAQALADPTRPPGGDTPGATDEGAAAVSRLQSVLIAPGRRIAVIDGRAVALGGTIGDARVVRITETEVELKRGTESEILRLLAGTEKKLVRSRGSGVREAGGAKR